MLYIWCYAVQLHQTHVNEVSLISHKDCYTHNNDDDDSDNVATTTIIIIIIIIIINSGGGDV
jgi:hypothetical protein